MSTDIIDGKHVIALLHGIQEVRSSIKTYNAFPILYPYSVILLVDSDKTGYWQVIIK